MFKIAKLSDFPSEPMASGRGSAIQLIGESTGASQVDVHVNILRPGGPDGPYHYHDHTENVYWILSGRGRLIVEGEVHEVEQDDVVFLPPKTRHSLSNPGTEELRLLEIYAPAGRDFVRVDG